MPRTTPHSTPITHLLYLHGFRSSPQSAKARLMAEHVRMHHPQMHWWCPQLPPSPAEACALIEDGTRGWPVARMAVVGSSLGGLYASWLASRTACRCVLLNPAVDPARDLAAQIGEQPSWHDEQQKLLFHAGHVRELLALQGPAKASPERWLAIIAKGDEVLDWREMLAHYGRAQVVLLDAGDHALSDFADHLPRVMAFLGLAD